MSGRKEKNNVDYFPFLCKEGKGMYYIEKKYKNDGYATWIKILRQIAVTDFHYLNLSSDVDMMFLASKCNISEETLIEIVNDLCKLGEFHSGLWHENRIIFSEKFVEAISEAYKKRSNECINLMNLFILLSNLGIRKLIKSEPEGGGNTQIRLDKKKEDNIRLEKKGNDDDEEIIFPENLSSDSFKKKFAEWIEFRTEIKKPYKSKKSINGILKSLANFDEEFAGRLIKRSIDNGWQGLIFEKTELEFKNYKHERTKTGGGNSAPAKTFGGL